MPLLPQCFLMKIRKEQKMRLNSIYNEICSKISIICDNPQFEAKELIKYVCNFNETEFLLGRDSEISAHLSERLFDSAEMRLSGVPLQYIIGEWDFMGHTFKVGEGVLIPRPETELLCQYVIDEIKEKSAPCVFDLCSGSGCIALSLKLAKRDTEVFAVEKSADAYKYLRINAEALCAAEPITTINGDIFNIEAFENLPKADIIVSNPPYINTDDISTLQKEVRCEPVMALDGGRDGLDFYRFIISEWKTFLKADGCFAFECGESQATAIGDILKENGFDSFIYKDYNDIDRFVIGRR